MVKENGIQPSVARSAGSRRRAIVASAIGTVIEHYDEAIYGLFIVAITASFFPSENQILGILAALGVFGVSFVARPFGGIFFGRFADLRGRRAALTTSIAVMTLATLGIGLLPTYSQIGIWAPALLVVCRLLQGFSKGGEFSSASIFIGEYVSPKIIGRRASYVGASAQAGIIVASLVALLITAVLPPEAINSFGWRIAFIFAGLLGIYVFYVRLKTEETPEYIASVEFDQKSARDVSLSHVLTANWRPMLQVAGLSALAGAFYLIVVYLPGYFVREVGLSPAQTSAIVLIVTAMLALTIPFAGILSDKIGRKRQVIISGVLSLIAVIPGFLLAGLGGFASSLIGSLVLAAPMALYLSAIPAILTELFDIKSRGTGAGLAYNVGAMVFGAPMPFLAGWLLSTTGNPVAPAYAVAGVLIVGVVAAITLPAGRVAPVPAAIQESADASVAPSA